MASKKEKKIFFKPEDELEVVLEKIADTSAERVILNFPKGSKAADDVENFHEISAKAKLKGKEILVESIDDHILEYASMARLPAINPVFRSRERAMFDIVVKPRAKQRATEKADETKINDKITQESIKTREQKNKKALKQKSEKQQEKEQEPEELEEEDKVKTVLGKLRAIKENRSPYETHEKQKERTANQNILKRILWWAGSIIALAGLWFVSFNILPEAKISITLKRAERAFQDTVFISTKASAWTLDDNGYIVLPGQLLSANKNAQIEVNAQGTQKVSDKAKGKLIIYNGYSSSPQQLVATTRFVSPEGKVFRLDKAITVPGAKVSGATITPSSVEAEVTAAEAGDSYNLKPATGWRIPGFQGTPRYNAFYAENKEAMSGGFIGERPSATAEDLAKGEEKLKNVLETALSAQMSILLSEKFKLIEGATSFELTKKELQSDPERPNKAILYGEATMQKLVFIEDMLAAALMEKYKDIAPENAKVDQLNAVYAPPTVNFTEGTLEVAASGTLALVSNISSDLIRREATGKNERELQNFILSLPGVERAKISFSPFWVSKAPKNVEKVNILIQ